MKPNPLNEEQAYFLETRLIPFTKFLGRSYHQQYIRRMQYILKIKSYNNFDKVIIELLMKKLKEARQ